VRGGWIVSRSEWVPKRGFELSIRLTRPLLGNETPVLL
jgi:hypothetical protein